MTHNGHENKLNKPVLFRISLSIKDADFAPFLQFYLQTPSETSSDFQTTSPSDFTTTTHLFSSFTALHTFRSSCLY